MKIEESLNVTFDETPPPSKTSPLVDDDLDEEEAIKEQNRYLEASLMKTASCLEIRLGCCLTSWFSKKQTALAISTTESKYVSAGKVCQQALWMKQALFDYDIRLDDVPILCNNKGAIDFSKNPVQHSRTKHIEICHHFLRDNVQKGNISIEKVPSKDNIAGILTKPLKRESFNYLRLGIKFNSDDDDPLYTLQSTLLFEDTVRCEYGLATQVMYLEGETQLCETQVGSRSDEDREDQRVEVLSLEPTTQGNLVWATSKHDVCLIYSIMHWSSFSQNLNEIHNLSGYVAPTEWEARALLLIGISINQMWSLLEGSTAMGPPAVMLSTSVERLATNYLWSSVEVTIGTTEGKSSAEFIEEIRLVYGL
ncbi:hypothetical protein Tco_0877571 [Tanacetum coccineum]|uniref:Copia protein n=1 Tax=Tanacetum coccineum TaxID=301880 RepID=A0ABQ5BVF5_9ASTR